MSDIYYLFIAFPIIFIGVLAFIFQSSVAEIALQQVIFNCPYPINGGIATNVTLTGTTIEYVATYDNNTGDYRVTVFRCQDANAGGLGPVTPQVTTSIYTGTGSWFDFTNRAQGYLFYISQSIVTFFNKVIAGGQMLYLLVNAPAEVTNLSFFTYINIVLIAFIAIGGFMIVRGS